MKSYFYHLQLNIDFANLNFYKSLFAFVGWKTIFEMEDTIGFKSDTSGDIWLVKTKGVKPQDRDNIGFNHVAIRVESVKEIDDINKFFHENKIQAMFETPRYRPEFVNNPQETYYQVMFESPDNILFEFVYIGKK